MNKKVLYRLNLLLFLEVLTLIGTTAYLAVSWNGQVTVGLNAVSLLWVEVLYLLYINFKERE